MHVDARDRLLACAYTGLGRSGLHGRCTGILYTLCIFSPIRQLGFAFKDSPIDMPHLDISAQ